MVGRLGVGTSQGYGGIEIDGGSHASESTMRVDIKWVGYDRIASNAGTFKVNPRTNAYMTLSFGTLWCLAWGCLSVLYFKAGSDLETMVMFIILLSVGIYLIYVSLAYLFNHTEIVIWRGLMRVRTRPFPFRPGRSIECSEINSMEVETGSRRGLRRTEWPFTILQASKNDGGLVDLLRLSGVHTLQFQSIAREVQKGIVASRMARAGPAHG